ncbi:hypothetical protein OG21DRAFT_1492243, partial [Imleria badia]
MDLNAEQSTIPHQFCPDCGLFLDLSPEERVSPNERIKQAMQEGQMIEAPARCGLCILASRCVERAIHIARRPHILCYKNIDVSTSVFVQQRPDTPAKIQSSTFPILYEITNANPDHMRLSPMLSRAEQATGLKFNHDICPTFKQSKAFGSQLHVHVIKILLGGDSAFYNYTYRSDPLLQHKPQRKLPIGIKTKQFPLRTSRAGPTIDDSYVSGIIAVIDD